MKIIEKDLGQKIDYTVKGTKLNINDELILDLARYERDFDVHIDISEDWAGMLTMGLADRYVAQIDIPARKYNELEIETENIIENDEGTEEREKTISLEPVPFSMENVTFTLWAIEQGRYR